MHGVMTAGFEVPISSKMTQALTQATGTAQCLSVPLSAQASAAATLAFAAAESTLP